MPTILREFARSGAGEVAGIVAAAISPTELLTAFPNGSGDLELILWYADASQRALTRGQDSGTQAGEVGEVALAVWGRRCLTAVQNGAGNLLVIPWAVEPDGTLSRLEYADAQARKASELSIAWLNESFAVTALRNGAGNLLVIPWSIDAVSGHVERLNTNDANGGAVRAPGNASTSAGRAVACAPLDSANVVIAKVSGSNRLEVSAWRFDAGFAPVRWAQQEDDAIAHSLAMAPIGDPGPVRDFAVAFRNADGQLAVAIWRVSAPDQTIVPVAEAGAGEVLAIATTACVTDGEGKSVVLVSARRGDGRLIVIAFRRIANAAGRTALVRTGDITESAFSDVRDTAVVALEPGRVAVAVRSDSGLGIVGYRVSDLSAALVRPLAEATAGDASAIQVTCIRPDEILVALRNGSGRLELIGWRAAAREFTVTRMADSGAQAPAAEEVALGVLGRRAITAIRADDGRLRLISWEVAVGMTAITRLHDTGTAAGEAERIALATLGADLVVTAMRNGAGHLLLIVWRLEPDGTLSRLNHETAQAGDVDLVSIEALDGANVITAVRNGSGNLQVIGWQIGADGGVHRWLTDGHAGEIGEVAITALDGGGDATSIVTSVRDGSGRLLLIAWRASEADRSITRLADSSELAGEATDLSACRIASPPSGRTVLATSMRRASGNFELIVWQLVADPAGIPRLVRIGDTTNRADTDVRHTACCMLESGRIAVAAYRYPGLWVSTYAITDAATAQAPANILELEFGNLGPPARDDTSWARSVGTYPLDVPFEWSQVDAPSEEYDDVTLIGASGWVVAPEDSGADVPFSHPFGFDWEFAIALDTPSQGLLSPANAGEEEASNSPNHNTIALADQLGLEVPEGLLGMEWDKGLLPASYRGQVNHGDRVAVLGRWILDNGHDVNGFYRTEIHPPLLMASASVVEPAERSGGRTRAIFLARPYLAGQTFTTNLQTRDRDGVDDDGSLRHHIGQEVIKVITLRSTMVEMHPKIKAKPFRGSHRAAFVVRPPGRRPTSDAHLAVSYRFTARQPCRVRVAPFGDDAVVVTVELAERGADGREYESPSLPSSRSETYSNHDLDLLSPGEGITIALGEIAISAVSALLSPLLVPFVATVLERGFKTDVFDPLPDVDVLDTQGGVSHTRVDQLSPGAGVLLDEAQPYPVTGWLDVYWAHTPHPGGVLTPETFNAWFAKLRESRQEIDALRRLRWRDALQATFDLDDAQQRALTAIPADIAKDVQRAVDVALALGGSIRIDRDEKTGEGTLRVDVPHAPGVMALSVGVFHCRFDAHCRHWVCGWGPAR